MPDVFTTAIEHDLQVALEANGIGTWEWLDSEQRFVLSPAARALQGLSLDGTVTMDDAVATVLEDDRPLLGAAIEASRDPGGNGRFEVGMRVRLPDGTIRWLALLGQTFFEGQGIDRHPVRAAGIVQDVTAREQAQRDRERFAADLAEERELLASRVEERTLELRRANAELERTGRYKDEFLSNLTHEVRSPLHSILGLSEALLLEAYGRLSIAQLGPIEQIRESGRHLLGLVNDMLDLARATAGEITLQLRPVEPEALCRSCLRLVSRDAETKKLAVSTRFDREVTAIHADQVRLKQVLLNLLSNAIKFTPPGGTIGLVVDGDRAEGVVHVAVWDTGVGIALDHMPRLFTAFSQADAGLDRRYDGIGIGLAIVGRLVELHGGHVRVESEPERGSRFTVTLPWHQQPEPPDDPHPSTRGRAEDPARDPDAYQRSHQI